MVHLYRSGRLLSGASLVLAIFISFFAVLRVRQWRASQKPAAPTAGSSQRENRPCSEKAGAVQNTPGTPLPGADYKSWIPKPAESIGDVAFTFDLGGSRGAIEQTLAVLQRYRVPAAFFLTGQWMQKNPDVTREIYQTGFTMGNHTFTHPDLRRLTGKQIEQQLQQTDSVARSITGHPLSPYFRPPYGDFDHRVVDTARLVGYRTVLWSVGDEDVYAEAPAKMIIRRILKKVQPGSIILMHGATPQAAEALPDIISGLRRQTYRLVPLEMLDHGQRILSSP